MGGSDPGFRQSGRGLSRAPPNEQMRPCVKRAKHFVWERDLAGFKAVSADGVSAYFARVLSRSTMEE